MMEQITRGSSTSPAESGTGGLRPAGPVLTSAPVRLPSGLASCRPSPSSPAWTTTLPTSTCDRTASSCVCSPLPRSGRAQQPRRRDGPAHLLCRAAARTDGRTVRGAKRRGHHRRARHFQGVSLLACRARLRRPVPPGPSWWVLADPEGNEACVATWIAIDGRGYP